MAGPPPRTPIVAAGGLAVFAVLLAGVLAGSWTDVDAALQTTLVVPDEPIWLQLVALPGDEYLVAGLVAVAAAWLWVRGRRGDALAAAAAVVITGAVVFAVKVLVDRERPVGADSTSGSFPSGHTAMATVGAAAFHRWVLPAVRAGVHRWTHWIVVALAVAVALARLALGEHWPSDVIASIALVGGVVALTTWVREAATSSRSRPGPRARPDPGTRPR